MESCVIVKTNPSLLIVGGRIHICIWQIFIWWNFCDFPLSRIYQRKATLYIGTNIEGIYSWYIFLPLDTLIYMLHRDSWISRIYQALRSKYLKHFGIFWESPKYSNVVWNPIKVFENIVLNAAPNPEKSRDLVFKNPGIGILVQSRDPGISRDPAGACSGRG